MSSTSHQQNFIAKLELLLGYNSMNKTLSAYFLKRRDDFYRILQEMALVSAPNVRNDTDKTSRSCQGNNNQNWFL